MLRAIALFALTLTLFQPAQAAEKHLVIELKSGKVVIDLLEDIAPRHVERISKLAQVGAYNGIAFHRVLEGFMVQTGDVRYGKLDKDGNANRRAGYGGSELPDLVAEFTETKLTRGMVAMARGGGNPNSANSQFFIVLEDQLWMNDPRDVRTFYTAWGRVISGMPFVDNIKLGDRNDNGAVDKPDVMIRVYLEDAPAS